MSQEIANYDAMLAQMAKAAVNVEKPSGSSISVRAGVLSYNGQPAPGNKLDVIVIASTHANLYYEGKYDPSNLTNPVCFAYSQDGENMVPHPKSSKPQGEDCDSCPMNQWGSDPDGGRGKACKNTRSLGLIPAGTPAAEIATAEVAVLKLPVMSVKNWQAYVQKCSALYSRPPLGLVTTIGTVPDQKSQFRITFTDTMPLGMDMVAGILPRIPDVVEILERVYDPNPEPAPDAAPKKARKF
jgi:hypothetical protein